MPAADRMRPRRGKHQFISFASFLVPPRQDQDPFGVFVSVIPSMNKRGTNCAVFRFRSRVVFCLLGLPYSRARAADLDADRTILRGCAMHEGKSKRTYPRRRRRHIPLVGQRCKLDAHELLPAPAAVQSMRGARPCHTHSKIGHGRPLRLFGISCGPLDRRRQFMDELYGRPFVESHDP